MVKMCWEDVGGNLYIHSEKGKGTTFTIVVPLSLATMECIRFRLGDCRFSVPARHVYRFLDLEKNRDNVENINGKDYILYEDRMVPLINLNRFYHLQAEEPEHPIVVYVKGNEKEGCIMVDYMYEQKRIVVKQLPPLFGLGFRKRTGISGCSIMGNGSVCAAIDTEILIGLYEKGGCIWKLTAENCSAFRGKIKAMRLRRRMSLNCAVRIQLSHPLYAGVLRRRMQLQGNGYPVISCTVRRIPGKTACCWRCPAANVQLWASRNPYITAWNRKTVESPADMGDSGIWAGKGNLTGMKILFMCRYGENSGGPDNLPVRKSRKV